MEKKQSNLLFIDRGNYANILDKKFNINNLVDVIYGDKVDNDLSFLTTSIIIETNDKLSKALFDHCGLNFNRCHINNKLSITDQNYVNHYVKTVLTKTELFNYVSDSDVEEKKYYELIPLVNNDILIIFEEAFFEIITESKDKLKEFILDCLCYQYKFDSNLEPLMKLYLSIQINETTLNMVKLRFN